MPDRIPSLTEVRSVIDRHDPEGLLAMGVPADEYEPEAAALARVLARGTGITSTEVVEVWEHWFGPGSGFVTHSSQAELDAFTADLDALGRRPAAQER